MSVPPAAAAVPASSLPLADAAGTFSPASSVSAVSARTAHWMADPQKLIPILGVLLTVVALPSIGWYCGQQTKQTYYDTLIQERGARNAETRQWVLDLRKDFDASQKQQAEFQGETHASLQAIKEALGVEQQTRRDERQAPK